MPLVGIKPSIVFSLAHAEQYEMKLNLYFGFGLAEIIQWTKMSVEIVILLNV